MKHLRYVLLLILSAVIIAPCYAQMSAETQRILDKCAANVRKCGNVKATFMATQFKRGEEQGSTDGQISVSGRKVYIDGGATRIWYDGKTQWAYSSSTGEVNVSTPTKTEAARMNPYSFVSLYKSGYRATMKPTTLRGKSCYEVHLHGAKHKILKNIYLTIDRQTMLPLCIRMSSNGSDWIRISIYEILKNQKFNSSTFRFNSKDFPKANVIDLR